MRILSSDTHVEHGNIIDYCRRPFGNVADMNTTLLSNLVGGCGPDDEFWHLGDVAMGAAKDDLGFIADVPAGRKVLVVGNHDRPFRRKGTPRPAADQAVLDAGFDEVVHGTTSLRIGRHEVLVSHFPYQGDSGDEERYRSHRPADRGQWLLHGHVHDVWRQRGRMINVGADAWAGHPVTEDQILELIEAGPRDLGPLPWVWDRDQLCLGVIGHVNHVDGATRAAIDEHPHRMFATTDDDIADVNWLLTAPAHVFMELRSAGHDHNTVRWAAVDAGGDPVVDAASQLIGRGTLAAVDVRQLAHTAAALAAAADRHGATVAELIEIISVDDVTADVIDALATLAAT